MEDNIIIEKYWKRDESAIRDTEVRYGKLLYLVSHNILEDHHDSEECVNDTYLKTWNSIPPVRPFSFKAFILKIVRNLSLNRYEMRKAGKRDSNLDVILNELEDCIPDVSDTESEFELRNLSDTINRWLLGLNSEDRTIFVRRYFFGEKLKSIAVNEGMRVNALSGKMFRLRQSLKKKLEEEGIFI